MKLNHTEVRYTKLSEQFINIKFPVFKIFDLLTSDEDSTLISNGVVALFSKSGCNPCQLRELKNLKRLNDQLKAKMNIKVIFCDFKNEMEILRLRKIADFTLPMYTTNFNLTPLFIEKPFPKIFFIKDQIIKDALIPIPNNSGYSNSYFQKIIYEFIKK